MADAREREFAFRHLVPINRLALQAQQRLWTTATVKSLAEGQVLFARDIEDGLIHYLLEGALDFLDQGRLVQRLTGSQRIARRPLAAPGPKRYTARTATPCTTLTLSRLEFDRVTEATRVTGAALELAASELAESSPGDWMARVMDSALFRVLPNDTIQDVFGALDALELNSGEVVLHQDEPGDFFYVLEHGYCEVSRRVGGARQEMHVVDLRPGDTFGEAAVISGHPRDASVIALTDVRLLRLSKVQFDRLIRAPLVHGISVADALVANRAGARWLDIGDPGVYAKAPLRNSRNIPLNALRVQAVRLAREDAYIVCCDDPSLSAVGAYILAERGLKAHFLNQSIVMMLTCEAGLTLQAPPRAEQDNIVLLRTPGADFAQSPANSRGTSMEKSQSPNAGIEQTAERVDRLYTQQEFEAAVKSQHPLADAMADTHTGSTLARLLEDIDARKDAIEQDATRSIENAQELGFDDSGTEFFDLGALEVASSAGGLGSGVTTPQPSPPVMTAAPVLDAVADIVHDLEIRVRHYVETNLLERTLDAERRYQGKVLQLQQHAQAALRKRDAELKQRYAKHYRQKDQVLRENYQKLMALATKISQQKAQLQITRKQMEEKLTAATAVYKQVEDMRRLLGENISSSEPLGSTPASRLSVR